MRKFLIDTDAGIDDSVAIMLAHSVPDIEITAITTCFGTASLPDVTNNVLNLCSLIGLDTRIGVGRADPLIQASALPGGFHGESGVGLAKFPPTRHTVDKAPAWDVIYQEAKKAAGKLTVVTLGPLSNLAVALLKYEDLTEYIEKIVIMGGTNGPGNVSAHVEANIAQDPHACEIVFRCGAPIVMAGLNATECTRMTTAEWNHMFSKRTRVSRILRDMFAVYKQSQNSQGETGLVIHDAAAITTAIDPAACKVEKRHVTTELVASSPMYGRTVPDIRPYADGEKNVDVVVDIDKARFMELIDQMLDFLS